jgi:NAD(P)-dependent dehydrogenase (short-subunit alcohol dehydrogenase family)
VVSPGTQTDLQGKVAIVTGASRGIGRAIAHRLGRGGIRLVLTARSEAALEETARAARMLGVEVATVATPDAAPDRVVSTAISAFGGIDILVNNAGTTKSGEFLTLTDEDWAEGYKVKLFGAARLCKAAWPELKRRRGSVINIAGAGGHTPDARFTIGGSVNSAVMAFTKALAQLGIEDGVQVNAVNPGLVRTDRLAKRIADAAQRWSVSLGDAERRMLVEHRIARFGEAEEIAELIVYVLSPYGRLFQGALIDADAGYTKGM